MVSEKKMGPVILVTLTAQHTRTLTSLINESINYNFISRTFIIRHVGKIVKSDY
jgi:hypothetical protein